LPAIRHAISAFRLGRIEARRGNAYSAGMERALADPAKGLA